MCDLYILAAEPSGDLQGSHLVHALRSRMPQIRIAGVAGLHLRRLGLRGGTRMEELQVMGFTDVIAALPRLYRLFRKIRSEILRLQPKAVVCIDYPGFNIRLERSLRRHGYKGQLIHFICPTVWAWGKKRIEIMAQNLDLLLTIFPFEKKCFEKTNLRVEYVGHPLIKTIDGHSTASDFRARYHLDSEKQILALFPGSRRTEIIRNFPIQLEAAQRLQKEKNVQIAVSLAHPEHRSLLTGPFGNTGKVAFESRSEFSQQADMQETGFAPQTRSHDENRYRSSKQHFSGVSFTLIEPEHRYELMRSAHLALATSGTVALELALFQTPTVVNFAIRPLDVFLARRIFRIDLPHYCIVNIIAGKTIFPELYGPRLSVESLIENALKLWESRTECQTACSALREILGNSDAAQMAAAAILGRIANPTS